VIVMVIEAVRASEELGQPCLDHVRVEHAGS
jgi:hypothetical protein